jgi:release factor glutamine methyltransferase
VRDEGDGASSAAAWRGPAPRTAGRATPEEDGAPAGASRPTAAEATALTIRDLVSYGAERLASSRTSAREDPSGESQRLMATATACGVADVLVRADEAVWWSARARFLDLVSARAEGVPLQILAGEVGFHDVVLSVEPGVFVPRPETELLVEEVLRVIDARRRAERDAALRVLDIGTGSGAIAVAVASAERGRPTRVHAGDVDPRAVRAARRNAARCAVGVDVRRSDLFGGFAELAGALDVVVSNPPYVSPSEMDRLPVEVRRFDPPRALFDPEGGTGFHRRIADAARPFLRSGGALVLEIGETQAAEVAAVLDRAGYRGVRILRDLAGRDRIACGLREGGRDSWTPSS